MDLLAPIATPEAGLLGLFAVSFLAATLLPGGSEAAMVALLVVRPDLALPAMLVASIGNTAGGMTTWAIGRALPTNVGPAGRGSERIATMQRWGPPALVLAWVPLVGDALCAAAGWLRLPALPCAAWMLIGKAARYGVIVAGFWAM